MLIDAGIDLNFITDDEHQMTCLHCAAMKRQPYAIFELLIKNGADVNAIAYLNTENIIYFYLLIKMGWVLKDPKVYTLLLENGFNLRD